MLEDVPDMLGHAPRVCYGHDVAGANRVVGVVYEDIRGLLEVLLFCETKDHQISICWQPGNEERV